MSHIIAPSLLAADFMQLKEEISMINSSEADWLHLDVMDGRFVPNISFGMNIIKSLNEICEKPLDCHLMIVEPEKYISEFADAGADILTVHLEASPHLHRTIQETHNAGMKAGVALNPHSSVQLLKDVLEDIDLICLMSVNPGFGGQKFIYNTIPKIVELKSLCIERNLNPYIEIDGGVGLQNAGKILNAGADVLVAGSAVFKAEKPQDVISRLKGIEQSPGLRV